MTSNNDTTSDAMEISPEMTLSEFFDAYVLPNFLIPSRAAPRNVIQYRESLRIWVQLTGNPRLKYIKQATASEFLQKLYKRKFNKKALNANTIRKHCTVIQKILDLAGPRSRHSRVAAGIMNGDLVYLERPPKQNRPVRDDFSLKEIASIVSACSTAFQTRNLLGIYAPVWWHSLFIFLMNTGMRIGTAMTAEWDMFETDFPGWINIPPEAYKGGRNGGFFYLNTHARRAINSVQRCIPKKAYRYKRLFPWLDWPESDNWIQTCRVRIMANTDIPPRRRFGFHGFRKFLGTWIAPQNALLASIVLGHKTANVTRDSYVNPKVVEELLERVPQPTITLPPWETERFEDLGGGI